MILFFNVLVTDTRFSQGFTNRVDRLDLFKHALASYARIDRITEVIVWAELEGRHKEREQELHDHVRALFLHVPCVVNSLSPCTQHGWQLWLNRTPLLTTAQPILYMGNDDHVFIDTDTDVLYEGLDLWAKEPADQLNTIHITSWTEAISTVYGLNEYTRKGRYWVADMLYPDACQIVNSLFFRHVFFDLQMGDTYMRRTDPMLTNWYPHLGDNVFPRTSALHPKVRTFIPLREQVRHFDAYPHVAVSFADVPQLTIPPAPPLSPEAYSAAHRRAMTAPHTRGFQDPRPRGNRALHYRHVPDHERLPLDEETLLAGLPCS